MGKSWENHGKTMTTLRCGRCHGWKIPELGTPEKNVWTFHGNDDTFLGDEPSQKEVDNIKYGSN